jgi:bifunctional enzyme CysN/CysC
VAWSEEVYRGIVDDYTQFAARLTTNDIRFVPMSALEGDNVVTASQRMPWYQGGPLLNILESVTAGRRRNTIDLRFPVQYVIRPNQQFRGYAGTVSSGTMRPGDEVVALPSGTEAVVQSIGTYDGARDEAMAGDAVVVTLDREIDLARGDMLVRRRNRPVVADRFDAYLCWMHDEPLQPGRSYVLMHTTRELTAFVERIEYRVDVDSMHREPTTQLGLNEIGRVEVVTAKPLCFDSYRVNGATGSFVLIDPATNATVGAGMIRGPVNGAERAGATASPNVTWSDWNIARDEREQRQGHGALVVWLTGLSGAGKSTIAAAVERALFNEGRRTMLLDGDQLRHGLNKHLGFSPADRAENIRRAGEVARLFFEAGHVVLCAFVSPYARDRDAVRVLLPDARFVEVHVAASADTLRQRDPKGLYAREAATGTIGLSGISTPYEAPAAPELLIDTDAMNVDEAVDAVLAMIRRRIQQG